MADARALWAEGKIASPDPIPPRPLGDGRMREIRTTELLSELAKR
jgi:hypothetical protein